MENYVYIVSSFHRSGSSMMMNCLITGGMDAVYTTRFDFLNSESGTPDYIPNPNGFFQNELDLTSFNPQMYEGKLLKTSSFRDLLRLPVGRYKVIFMVRNPQEIKASMEKMSPYDVWPEVPALDMYDLVFPSLQNALAQRRDIQITYLNYADVVNDPSSIFNNDLSDWPITDRTAAASVVTPALYRLRLENK